MKRKTAAARKRLKKHVAHKGNNGDFELTHSFCFYWWRRLNIAVFDNRLNPPKRFEIRNFRTEAGWCQPFNDRAKHRSVKIGINSTISDRKTFLTVLAHEMVHQWEWEILREWKDVPVHGPNFFMWKDMLAYRAGLPLTRCIDI